MSCYFVNWFLYPFCLIKALLCFVGSTVSFQWIRLLNISVFLSIYPFFLIFNLLNRFICNVLLLNMILLASMFSNSFLHTFDIVKLLSLDFLYTHHFLLTFLFGSIRVYFVSLKRWFLLLSSADSLIVSFVIFWY